MHMMSQILLAGAGLFVAGLLAGCGSERAGPARPRVRIGETTWAVELAMDPPTRERGLSGRTNLGPGEGMLFIYPESRVMNFWMEDCLIPIDIVFIGPDLRVVNAYSMAVEPDRRGRTRYSSQLPAQYALEVAGGTVDTLGIRAGDVVEFIDVPPAETAEP